MSYIAKTEFSLGLIKLRIISLNFQELHFDEQKILSTSIKFPGAIILGANYPGTNCPRAIIREEIARDNCPVPIVVNINLSLGEQSIERSTIKWQSLTYSSFHA